jgi:hypothetical protein
MGGINVIAICDGRQLSAKLQTAFLIPGNRQLTTVEPEGQQLRRLRRETSSRVTSAFPAASARTRIDREAMWYAAIEWQVPGR